ncbi:MAG: YHS domain-containing protein [Armatimonadetes bacterium]|nr:YHS domain-containing protein [Armatimonadota bacterium]
MRSRTMMVTVTATMLVSLAGCGPKAPAEPAAAPPAARAAAPAQQPVNTTCPVEKGNKVNPKLTVEYHGKVYAFCCADCPAKFKADPEKYIAEMNADTKPTTGAHDMSKMKPGETMDQSKMTH